MKKTPVIVTVVILVLIGAGLAYRSYKADAERTLATQREADERAATEQRRIEIERRAAADAESGRLAALQAQQEAAATEKNLAQLRADEAAATVARQAAEADLTRLTAERERLRLEKEAAQGEARRLAEIRERAAADAEQARLDALEKLAAVEREKRDTADRESARLASLKHQQELEAAQPHPRHFWSIYPSDYKRREHYYLEMDLLNTNFVRPFTKPMSQH
jgi:hypothetical protein